MLFGGLIMAGCGSDSQSSGPTATPLPGTLLDPPKEVSDFTLTSDTNQPFHLSDLRGKVAVLFFGYTHCPDVCPLSLAHLHAVMQRLGKLADQVRIVFVSVDPERDTPKVLHHYVSAFDKYAIGVTGSSDAIRDLTRDYRVAFSHEKPDSDGNYEVSHSSAVFIFDRKGKARLISGSADNIDAITHDVRQLIEESP